MNLIDIVQRVTPAPWSEGDNIPWSDPGFSQRMLKEHLSQAHDAASRRTEKIERHVNFIHNKALGGMPSRVLDLGCGPGLYGRGLSRLGHSVRGIDYSPASIAYARQVAEAESLNSTFALEDIRLADFGEDGSYDLVMLIFGEYNTFKPEDARLILRKANAALKPGGRLLLEPDKAAVIRAEGQRPPVWSALQSGLFSERPHVLLEEFFWDESHQVTTNRYYVIDTQTGAVERYAASHQAYREEALRGMLSDFGFGNIQFFPNLTGEEETAECFAVLSEKTL